MALVGRDIQRHPNLAERTSIYLFIPYISGIVIWEFSISNILKKIFSRKAILSFISPIIATVLSSEALPCLAHFFNTEEGVDII